MHRISYFFFLLKQTKLMGSFPTRCREKKFGIVLNVIGKEILGCSIRLEIKFHAIEIIKPKRSN